MPGANEQPETSIDWSSLISSAARISLPTPSAVTFIHGIESSASKPALLECSDDQRYFVKGHRINVKSLYTEQVVALLGKRLNAPIPEIALVDVTSELIKTSEFLKKYFSPGISHALLEIAEVSDKITNFSSIDVNEGNNRQRYSALAVLYGWMKCGDGQILAKKKQPRLVFSVDHGHFFNGGPRWTTESLNVVDLAEPFPPIVNGCGLSPEDLYPFIQRLSKITKEDIAQIVATPPDHWGTSFQERVKVAEYLYARQMQIIFSLEKDTGEKEGVN